VRNPPPVLPREDPGVAPALTGRVADLLGTRPEIEDVDDEQVTRLGALDRDRPREHVRAVEIHVADVVGGVVVVNLRVRPLAALDPELAPGPHRRGGRDVRVPAVVAGHRLLGHRLGLVDRENDLGHGTCLP
jgi:hypothetical protein